MFFIILFIIIGFILIIKGGNMFVDSSVWLAKKTKIPQILIGATIVSIGTTLPEITVSVIAAIEGDIGLSMSNAVGSIFCNTALILGIVLTFSAGALKRKDIFSKLLILFLNCVVLLIFTVNDFKVNLFESIVLLCIFATYMWLNIYDAKKQMKLPSPEVEKTAEKVKEKSIGVNILFFILGAIFIACGSMLLVNNVSKLATDYLHISTTIVGFTVVAIGTSLPELVTAITSIRKKTAFLSFGNIIGANIINGSFIVGLTSIIGGGVNGALIIDPQIVIIGLVAFLACFVIIAVPLLIKEKTFKWQGLSCLAIYIAYLVYIIITNI